MSNSYTGIQKATACVTCAKKEDNKFDTTNYKDLNENFLTMLSINVTIELNNIHMLSWINHEKF